MGQIACGNLRFGDGVSIGTGHNLCSNVSKDYRQHHQVLMRETDYRIRVLRARRLAAEAV